MAADDFDTTVEQLYGAPAAQFVATRDAAVKRARAAGDRELADRIKQLRRPTAAAAVLNRYLRGGDTDDLDALIELGEKLRAAQRELDVPAMRELGAERTPLIAAVVVAVEAVAPDELTATVREQLSQTLTAAVADADAARAVRSGHLVAALSYSGFGEVDLRDAVAVPLARRTEDAGGHTDTSPEAPAQEDRAKAAAEQHLAERLAILTRAQQAEESAQQSAQLADRALAAARRTAQNSRARATEASAARAAAEAEVAEARARVRRS
ncbi:hypothetical protein [Flexivirga oryzae]|uniref:Uncharacterized protein n=1 Tax=Flexivirga oryzae TaxID=1794944 RepID=A0A839NBF3_9MICO|nr:hypothetical protein [Flexivirga oryzae]MBB2893304.1 hypothetical protein [Flexivirga oryzae]